MEKIEVIPYNKPIEFKEINYCDFEGYDFQDSKKTIIKPNEKGYISEALMNVIDLEKENTTVINAGVGQGKTKSIIDFVKYYYQENKKGNKYKIVIVTPFKSLNKEYINKIIEASNLKNICFDYQELEELGAKNKYKEFYSKPIQLISVKSILGDPGTVAHKQSDIKRKYYEYLIENAKKSNEKIILIFDEIHESLNSFTTDLLPNLFLWKDVVHKAVIASATYSEASISAIRFIALLTNKKIEIIESKRSQQVVENLSELNLCFYNAYRFDEEDQFIKDLIEKEIKDASIANILCFSNKLSKKLYNSTIGGLLKNKFGSVKLCTSDSKDFFDHKSCNIGTRFKTGISIEKEGSVYFVIMPTRFAYQENEQKLGIFSDRINSVIQALARPRKKSKIFIITPSPDKLIVSSNYPKDYIKKLSLGYSKYDEKEYQSNYLSLSSQSSILKKIYKENRSHIEKEISYMEWQENLNKYPKIDLYRLTKGDAILYNHSDSYGKNLPNYIYWAAWNNQFVNCKLKSIIKVSTYKFTEGSVQNMLDNYFNKEFFRDTFFTLNSDKLCYHKIRNTLFSSHLLYKKGKVNKPIISYRNLSFERQLITFIQRKKYPFNYFIRKKIYAPDGEFYDFKGGDVIRLKKPIDSEIEKLTYFRLAIYHSFNMQQLDGQRNFFNPKEIQLIDNYSRLWGFKEVLLNEYSDKDSKGVFLPLQSKFKFKTTHVIVVKSIIENILDNDVNLKVFDIRKRNFNTDGLTYKFLLELFFVIKRVTKNKEKVLKILKEHELLPGKSDYINLIYDIQDAWLLQGGMSSVFSKEPPK